MNNNQSLRKHLLFLLKEEGAHAGFDSAVKNLPTSLRGKKPKGVEHSAWQLVEHLRIAQSDILEFTRDAKHESPKWPEGYWPKSPEPPDDKAWDKSIRAFRTDLKALEEIVSDPKTDLFAPLPHAQDKTVLREILLVADHNAYHIGALISLRRLLGAWLT
ncbi:MAG: DinB family protein [Terriglobales bacterium]|jgi:hypothetical protein